MVKNRRTGNSVRSRIKSRSLSVVVSLIRGRRRIMPSYLPPRMATCKQVRRIPSTLILVPLYKPSLGLRFLIRISGAAIFILRQEGGRDAGLMLCKYSNAKGSAAAESSAILTCMIASTLCSSPGILSNSTLLKSLTVSLRKARIALPSRARWIVTASFNNDCGYG